MNSTKDKRVMAKGEFKGEEANSRWSDRGRALMFRRVGVAATGRAAAVKTARNKRLSSTEVRNK